MIKKLYTKLDNSDNRQLDEFGSTN